MSKTKPFDKHSDKYERWFVDNQYAFQSELNAIKMAMPVIGEGVEIGVGTGVFAEPLGIKEGIEPSKAMREIAKKRNIKVIEAVAEKLPYHDKSKDFVLMITTICFVDDIFRSFNEAHRILKDSGSLIIGFIDRNSPVGIKYSEHKEKSVFYKEACFYGTEELYGILKNTGFEIENTYQTVFGKLDEINNLQEVLTGHGQGSYVVIKAKKG